MGALFNARKIWPRYGEPWSVAEDKRLRKLHKRMLRLQYLRRLKGEGRFSINYKIGKILGRTACAISTRLATLKVCACK